MNFAVSVIYCMALLAKVICNHHMQSGCTGRVRTTTGHFEYGCAVHNIVSYLLQIVQHWSNVDLAVLK